MRIWTKDVRAEGGAPAVFTLKACIRNPEKREPYFAVIASLTYKGQTQPERFGFMPLEVDAWMPEHNVLMNLSGTTFDPTNEIHAATARLYQLEFEK